MPDRVFDEPRLARIYDDLDSDRSDLDLYATVINELGARSVLDVGCGTGELAVRLAGDGIEVVGVDPARAMLDVARAKSRAERVTWILGDATTLPQLHLDAATMTGNVAQVFLTDHEWEAALGGIGRALAPDGHLVFETRIPSRRAWESWTRSITTTVTDTAAAGRVESWVQVTDVDLPLVTFTAVCRFLDQDDELVSTSTLRFRERDEIEVSLDAAGYGLVDVRDAPDRPGFEWVFLARRR